MGDEGTERGKGGNKMVGESKVTSWHSIKRAIALFMLEF